jgi:hypothetical protein
MGLSHIHMGQWVYLLQRHHYYGGRNWKKIIISGTKRAIKLTFLQVKDISLLHMHMGLWVYCSATTTMLSEIGTK